MPAWGPPPGGAPPRGPAPWWGPAPPRGSLYAGLSPGARPPNRAMVLRKCWHSRPVFRLTIRVLQDPDLENHMTALVFFTEASGQVWRAGGGLPLREQLLRGPWPDSHQAGRRCSGHLVGHLESQALSLPGATESRL